mmetsp:Transcript_38859/g.58371  ORF Transcript_38859/g.58371 Transcript_38859/m.58371 type:complete len:88 (+) Transcript_38859:315-578(+)
MQYFTNHTQSLFCTFFSSSLYHLKNHFAAFEYCFHVDALNVRSFIIEIFAGGASTDENLPKTSNPPTATACDNIPDAVKCPGSVAFF